MAKHFSMTVDVDLYVDEVLEEIGDKELQEELERRAVAKLPPPLAPEERALVEEALLAIRRGDVAEAELVLERCLFPRWQSPTKCGEAYNVLMRRAA